MRVFKIHTVFTMKEHLIELIKAGIENLNQAALSEAAANAKIQIDQTKNPEHGDFASNIALVLSKAAGMPPRDFAQQLCDALPDSEHVLKTEIAGPGFINFFLNADSQFSIIKEISEAGNCFGTNASGAEQNVQVEFVSANPTGPLHVGHGRGAAYGACVANLLEACGYKVQREYYVNDAGRQMDILATSIWLRYLQLDDAELVFPSNGYKGDYIVDYAKQLKAAHGDVFAHSTADVFANVHADEPQGGDKEKHIDDLIAKAKTLLGAEYDTVFDLGLTEILNDIREDLIEFSVHFDNWFSERSLSKEVDTVIKVLQDKGLIEEREGALWFLSEQLGDDKDRVIKRSNGQTTYFASDIAYHYEKFQRGFDKVINVWGADHHGYIARVKAALQALDIDPNKLEIKLVQLVSLYRGEEQVSMSTRSGEFVSLKDLRDEVGKDAARFFYVMRKVEQATDFDLELAKKTTNENPVYYVQYAHARICSIARKFAEAGLSYSQDVAFENLNLLQASHETQLLKKLATYKDVIMKAGTLGEPHTLVNYLRELAADFHSYYNACKIITEEQELSQARAALCFAVKQVLANGLALLDISQPENM